MARVRLSPSPTLIIGTNTQSTREDSQDILNLEIKELSKACAAYSKANRNIVSFNFEGLKCEEGKTLSLDQIKSILNGIFSQEVHRDAGHKRWFEHIVDFCVKLYPLSNFSLGLLAPAAEVCSIMRRLTRRGGVCFQSRVPRSALV
jgi:hypothetical protein